MNKLTSMFMIGMLPLIAGAENLFQGDTGVECSTKFVTEGGLTGYKLITRVRDTKVKYEGSSSLRIDWKKKLPYGNTGHWAGQYFGVLTPELEYGCDYTVSFYAKACADNYPIGVHLFSAQGWTAASSYYLKTTLSKEWKRYEFTFRPKVSKDSASLAYSLNIMMPCNGKFPDGPVWFDAFQLEKGKKATPYVSGQSAAVSVQLKSGKPMHIIGKGDKIESAVKAINLKNNGKTTLEVTVVDWQGNLMKKYTVPFGKELQKSFALPSNRYGWFMASAKVLAGNSVLTEGIATYMVVRPPVKLAPGMRAYMGVSRDNGVLTEEAMAVNRAMGASRIQINVKSSGYRHNSLLAPGKYDFTFLDLKVKNANKYNLAVKLSAVGPFAWPYSFFTKEEAAAMKKTNSTTMLFMRHRKMYSDYIRILADRYGDKVETFDLGSEDNGSFGISTYFKQRYPQGVQKDQQGRPWILAGPDFDTLCTLLTDAAKILRERCPKARVACIRPSQGRPGDEWLFVWKEYERIGRYFNSFSIDTYSMVPYYIHYKRYPRYRRSGGGPDGRFVTAEHVNRMIKKYGPKEGQDFYMSETGVNLLQSGPEVSPERQEEAGYTVRDMVAARCAGFSSYDLFCGYSEHTYAACLSFDANGINGMHMRAAAYSALAQHLENVVETKWQTPDKDTRLAFLKHYDKTGVCVVWSQKGYTLKVPEGLKVYEIMGNEVTLSKDRLLKLSETPCYLTHKDYNTLVKKLEKPVIDQSDFCSVAFRRKTIGRGLLKFTNNSNQDELSLDAVVKLDNGKVIKKSLEIPQGSWNTFSLDVPANVKKIEVKYCNREKKNRGMTTMFDMHDYTAIGSGAKPQSELGRIERQSDILPDEPWVPWTGVKDLSMVLYGSWDKNFLHLKAVVQDDKHYPARNIDKPWDGDSLQLAIDPKNNGGFFQRVPGRSYDVDDIEVGIMLTAQGKKNLVMSDGDKKIIGSIRYEVTRNEKAGTTIYTIDLPWAKLGVKPVKGMTLGLSTVIFDDDTGKGNECYGPIGAGVATRFKTPVQFKKFYLK